MTDERKADVWMPLLIDRYLGDTTMLSAEQHGVYLLLLMAMWKAGGTLPDDDKKLANIGRLTPARWKGMRDTIRPFFRPDGQGNLVQKRLMFELERAQARSEKGAKGARSRWQTDAQGDAKPDAQVDAQVDAQPDAKRHAKTVLNGMPDACPPPLSLQSDSSLRSESSGLSSSSLRSEESRPVRASPGEACKAMRKAGIADVNPNHPDLREMLAQGLTISELVSASKIAMDSNASKPFVYALSVARSARERAAKIALAPAAPGKRGDKLAADILAAAASHGESPA